MSYSRLRRLRKVSPFHNNRNYTGAELTGIAEPVTYANVNPNDLEDVKTEGTEGGSITAAPPPSVPSPSPSTPSSPGLVWSLILIGIAILLFAIYLVLAKWAFTNLWPFNTSSPLPISSTGPNIGIIGPIASSSPPPSFFSSSGSPSISSSPSPLSTILTINVADFGVHCDGVTDDTSAIARAFTAAVNNATSINSANTKVIVAFSGSCVYANRGGFNLNYPNTILTPLVIEGNGCTFMLLNDGTVNLPFANFLTLSYMNSITIQNFIVDTLYLSWAQGIAISTTQLTATSGVPAPKWTSLRLITAMIQTPLIGDATQQYSTSGTVSVSGSTYTVSNLGLSFNIGTNYTLWAAYTSTTSATPCILPTSTIFTYINNVTIYACPGPSGAVYGALYLYADGLKINRKLGSNRWWTGDSDAFHTYTVTNGIYHITNSIISYSRDDAMNTHSNDAIILNPTNTATTPLVSYNGNNLLITYYVTGNNIPTVGSNWTFRDQTGKALTDSVYTTTLAVFTATSVTLSTLSGTTAPNIYTPGFFYSVTFTTNSLANFNQLPLTAVANYMEIAPITNVTIYIDHVRFEGNIGSGIRPDTNSRATITNCQFINNGLAALDFPFISQSSFGTLFLEGPPPSNLIFSNNYIQGSPYSSYGSSLGDKGSIHLSVSALYDSNTQTFNAVPTYNPSAITIFNGTISNNIIIGTSGYNGIFVSSANNITISNNTVSGISGGNDAVYADQSTNLCVIGNTGSVYLSPSATVAPACATSSTGGGGTSTGSASSCTTTTTPGPFNIALLGPGYINISNPSTCANSYTVYIVGSTSPSIKFTSTFPYFVDNVAWGISPNTIYPLYLYSTITNDNIVTTAGNAPVSFLSFYSTSSSSGGNVIPPSSSSGTNSPCSNNPTPGPFNIVLLNAGYINISNPSTCADSYTVYIAGSAAPSIKYTTSFPYFINTNSWGIQLNTPYPLYVYATLTNDPNFTPATNAPVSLTIQSDAPIILSTPFTTNYNDIYYGYPHGSGGSVSISNSALYFPTYDDSSSYVDYDTSANSAMYLNNQSMTVTFYLTLTNTPSSTGAVILAGNSAYIPTVIAYPGVGWVIGIGSYLGGDNGNPCLLQNAIQFYFYQAVETYCSSTSIPQNGQTLITLIWNYPTATLYLNSTLDSSHTFQAQFISNTTAVTSYCFGCEQTFKGYINSTIIYKGIVPPS